MKKQLIITFRLLAVMTVLLGVIYPLCITGIAQLVFPDLANGSLVEIDGTLRGSSLIGQKMDSSEYFHPRPSVIEYNASVSGASNLGMTNKKLYDEVAARKKEFITKNKLSLDTHVPSEMLFASASGLDPHISPDAARMQIDRIASARGLDQEQKKSLESLIDKMEEGPQFGILGCPRVNVFMLNLELDRLK